MGKVYGLSAKLNFGVSQAFSRGGRLWTIGYKFAKGEDGR
jgi:hypothetical protein